MPLSFGAISRALAGSVGNGFTETGAWVEDLFEGSWLLTSTTGSMEVRVDSDGVVVEPETLAGSRLRDLAFNTYESGAPSSVARLGVS
tara:strand:- start:900 stop:1163 length:264 start_codon:yes stop_codon:yes gene_type:complete